MVRILLRSEVSLLQSGHGFLPRVHCRRDGIPRSSHLYQQLHLSVRKARQLPSNQPRQYNFSRAGAHVVRRFGDNEVVERFVAERKFCRFHVLLLRTANPERFWFRDSGGVPDDVLAQGMRIHGGPASDHSPNRLRSGEHIGRRQHIRRHHLFQGGGGAQTTAVHYWGRKVLSKPSTLLRKV